MTLKHRLMPNDTQLFLERLTQVFSHMDQAYNEVAKAYGFECCGCQDNCCYSRFYHHTLLEYAYIHQGLDNLPPSKQQDILSRAKTVVSINEREDKTGTHERVMCPVNENGLCLLYTHRPMVCRLHGLSHELRKPGHDGIQNPGCDLFAAQTQNMDYRAFDRTPLYIDLAQLEREFRLKTGITDRLKYTIAEMLIR